MGFSSYAPQSEAMVPTRLFGRVEAEADAGATEPAERSNTAGLLARGSKKSSSRQIRRRKKQGSNPRSLSRKREGYVERANLENRRLSNGGPRVRIHLPPPASPVR